MNHVRKKSWFFKLIRCFIGVGFLLFLFIGIALFFNWGIWRSTSYELMGLECDLKVIYKTDVSTRVRGEGYFITVYQLPDDINAKLTHNNIELSEYPMFSGLEHNGYKRIKWANGFPKNYVERMLFDFF